MFFADRFRTKGDLARDRKQWVEAARAYRRYLKLAPEDTPIWVQLGHVLKEGGDLVEAETAYRAAADLAPTDADSRLHLAHLLKRIDRAQLAAITFREVMQLAPTPEVIDELTALGHGREASSLVKTASIKTTASGRYLEMKDIFDDISNNAVGTGITRVVINLLNYVLEDLDEAEAACYHFVCRFGDGEVLSLLSKQKLRRLVQLVGFAAEEHAAVVELITDIKRTAVLIQLNYGDVYFYPGAFWEYVDNTEWLISLKARGVIIGAYIYDLIPITHAQYCSAKPAEVFSISFAEVARYISFCLTISEFVARDVGTYLRSHAIPAFQALPIPLAHEHSFDSVRSNNSQRPTSSIQALGDHPFVLCVCTIEARKNHVFLLAVWQKMIAAGLDVPDLVLVGRLGWCINDFLYQVEESHYLGGRLHIIHGMSDTDLAWLYKKCLFTVFPSFVEGWGLPVGESLSYGKVCVASSMTSVPEVGGDLVVYIDPFNIDSGYKAISELILDKGRRAELEARIRDIFVTRTWKDFGRNFFARMDQALGNLGGADGVSEVYAPRLREGKLLGLPWLHKAITRPAEYARNPIRLIFASGWRGIEETGIWVRGSTANLRFGTHYEPGREVYILLEVGSSPWVDEENTLRVWVCDTARKRGDEYRDFYYAKSLRRNFKFWIRMKGEVGAGSVVTVRFQIDGAIKASEPHLPVAVRLHAIGFVAVDDYAGRISLLEQAVLSTS